MPDDLEDPLEGGWQTDVRKAGHVTGGVDRRAASSHTADSGPAPDSAHPEPTGARTEPTSRTAGGSHDAPVTAWSRACIRSLRRSGRGTYGEHAVVGRSRAAVGFTFRYRSLNSD